MNWILLLFLAPLWGADPISDCQSKNLAKAKELNISESETWLNLLHYRDGLFTPHSEADGTRFFLAANGSKDPKAELKADILAFCENKILESGAKAFPKLNAACMYPAREQYLSSLGLGGWPKPECPNFEEWKTRVGDKKVHMVFSSYYANNPSTVFGHTLLRFDKIDPETNQIVPPLLSHGVNFAAEANISNPLLYSLFGIIGGFPGVFTSMPYYYKVREYSDFDSRDLWEYGLNLSQEEINFLLKHIWEQGFTHYNYFYFSENCSYHLLTTLDTVIPKYRLDKKIPHWVIPIDTVKALTTSPGLVSEVRFRPSLYRQYSKRLNRLEELNLEDHFYRWVDGDDQDISELTPQQQALVLDAVLDYWDFKHSKELLDRSSEAYRIKSKHLIARSKLPVTEPLEFDPLHFEQPDQGHETARLGLARGISDDLGDFFKVDLRLALHDYLDPAYGYPNNGKVEFARIRLNYLEEDKTLLVDELKFFEVQLLSPLSRMEKSWSWRAVLGLNRSYLACDYCLAGDLLFQGGGALGFFADQLTFFSLLGTDLRISSHQEQSSVLLFPTATVGFKGRAPFGLAAQGVVNYYLGSIYALENQAQLSLELRKNFGVSWAIGLESSATLIGETQDDSYSINSFFYF